ncbi:MAG: hypothetical protein L0Z54_02430, partial [Thermoplasmata archaeon]|nr:hypothetical protein [Thermoplasmata archaeon]
PSIPSLIITFGGAYLRLLRTAKAGSVIFRKELVDQGIDATTADELTEIYLSVTDIKPLLGGLSSDRR